MRKIGALSSYSGRWLGNRVGPVTFALLVISIAVYLLSFTPLGRPIYSAFLISHYAPVQGGFSAAAWQQLLQGEIWRLVTPIFLHFNLLHILFNMVWLYQLGTLIELKESSGLFTLQVLTIGIGSNLAQYWVAGPLFGGMSGVIYGLFGYIWLRAKFDPWSGYYIDPGVVIIMLIWLVLCFTGLLGPIANTAHLTGLLLGGAWAWVLKSRPRRR